METVAGLECHRWLSSACRCAPERGSKSGVRLPTSPHSKEPMLPSADPPQELNTVVRSGVQPRRACSVPAATSCVMMAAPPRPSAAAPRGQLSWRQPTNPYRTRDGGREGVKCKMD